MAFAIHVQTIASLVAMLAFVIVAAASPLVLDDFIADEDALMLLQHRAHLNSHLRSELKSFAAHGTSSKGIVRLLDFTKATLVANNLGGLGPWKQTADGTPAPQEIRFRNLVANRKIDLVVTADEGYTAFNVSRNGILGGNAQINAKSGTTASLTFSFVAEGTYTPEPMPIFYITFSDVDERHGGVEKEMIAVEGFNTYYTNDDLDVIGKNTSAPAFESVDFGNYADNDFHPDSPSPIQLTHAVSFKFLDKSTFRASFIVSQDGDDIKGRNILFSGISQLVFCQEPSTYFDFTTAVVSSNNLGGMGPHNDSNQPKELRYGGIGSYAGQSIDLVLSAASAYKPWNVSQNGLHGQFGLVNLFTGPDKNSSEVNMRFQVVAAGTMTPVKLDAFAIMFFDFDCGLHEQQIEYIEVAPTLPGFAGGAGYASYIATETTELLVTQQEDGGERFEATKHGTEADNPLTSQNLARETADRSIVFTYRYASEFYIKFGITPNGFNTGRNFMFAGQDMYLMCD